ncbi:ABC transporter permease [Sediminibacillus halophilus]|uniref:ABC-2 type transport system permease protein n=1 Tax=Sediminibacillus halophilus TaxID=482461 RepID=A0A1G9PR48_9BACI|nr:ABC transporter permease [Sediminibacillus halophilus]SDM00941.1 ABC-2 type transport system permease protein [Sediminibacillus halophilus]
MSKFWIVLSHTYMTRFKTKSFLITNIIALLVIVGLANINSIIDLFDSEKDRQVAVLDETGDIFAPLKESVENTASDVTLEQYEGTAEEAKQAVEEEEYEAFLSISYGEQNLPQASYYANQIASSELSNTLEQQLQQIKVAMATNNAGIDQSQLEEIYQPVAFEAVALKESAKTEEELSEARGLVYIILFLLYISVITYGNMIAMDIANEKTSRVMEILISSASPVSQMFAKILGIALLGLTQVGLFIVVGYIVLQQKQSEMTGGVFEYFGLSGVTASTFIYGIVFFVLGYLLYATLAAMLGSLVSRIEDVQQLMMPMIFLVMIAFFIAMFGLNMPESSFVTVTSYIPFFTPMLMFLRVGMLDIPAWEVALSIVIMLASIALLAALGARVYRGGVLMYGKASSLKDFKKALQLSKKS